MLSQLGPSIGCEHYRYLFEGSWFRKIFGREIWGYIWWYSLKGSRFPWAPVFNLALSAVGQLLLCRSTFMVTNTSSVGRAWGTIALTVIDSKVIVSIIAWNFTFANFTFVSAWPFYKLWALWVSIWGLLVWETFRCEILRVHTVIQSQGE